MMRNDPNKCDYELLHNATIGKSGKFGMKVVLSLYLLLFGLHLSACSNGIDASKSGASGLKPAENVGLNSEVNLHNTAVLPIETSSANPRDVLLFDGKNYIKKSGWETPSNKKAYIDEKYDQGKWDGVTKSGKRVRTMASSYSIRPPWYYSQEFRYEGGELDYLKGNLVSNNFLEISFNGKVFLYSISAATAGSWPTSNSEPHDDPFVYEIMDSDGDGIFETLLRDLDDIIVPNWVLK